MNNSQTATTNVSNIVMKLDSMIKSLEFESQMIDALLQHLPQGDGFAVANRVIILATQLRSNCKEAREMLEQATGVQYLEEKMLNSAESSFKPEDVFQKYLNLYFKELKVFSSNSKVKSFHIKVKGYPADKGAVAFSFLQMLLASLVAFPHHKSKECHLSCVISSISDLEGSMSMLDIDIVMSFSQSIVFGELLKLLQVETFLSANEILLRPLIRVSSIDTFSGFGPILTETVCIFSLGQENLNAFNQKLK